MRRTIAASMLGVALVAGLSLSGCGPEEYKNSKEVPAGDLSTKQVKQGQPIANPGKAAGPGTVPVSTIPMNGKVPGK